LANSSIFLFSRVNQLLADSWFFKRNKMSAGDSGAHGRMTAPSQRHKQVFPSLPLKVKEPITISRLLEQARRYCLTLSTGSVAISKIIFPCQSWRGKPSILENGGLVAKI
jgi:hypothetical protein